MTLRVYSLGYEGRELPEFIRLLKSKGIERVADVRNAPFSRKPGFSKKDLEPALHRAGLEYMNFPALGAPRELRERVGEMGWEEFLKAYRRHFAGQAEFFEQLVRYLGPDGGAIICVERNSRECHRCVIEKALRMRGYQVIALLDDAQQVLF
jgi:uncharacterized protein (DUF488 family)